MAPAQYTDLLDMLQARRPNDNGIAVLALHQAMMRHPAECDLGERQIVHLRDIFDLRQGTEVSFVPVPAAVALWVDISEGTERREL